MAATHLKKVGRGATTGWKTKKHLEAHFVTNNVNGQQVRNMTRYKKSTLKRQSQECEEMST